jgi:DNA-binding response OmpR family regulator
MLPRASGTDLCRRLRAASDIPIIMLTARSETKDRIQGLEAGADDYIAKPFHPRELALRAEALVRRTRGQLLSVGDLQFEDGRVLVNGQPLRLSTTELRLLTTLAAAPEVSVSYADLVLQGWRMLEGPGSREMLKTAVYRLRKHLREAGSQYSVTALRGTGYALTKRTA